MQISSKWLVRRQNASAKTTTQHLRTQHSNKSQNVTKNHSTTESYSTTKGQNKHQKVTKQQQKATTDSTKAEPNDLQQSTYITLWQFKKGDQQCQCLKTHWSIIEQRSIYNSINSPTIKIVHQKILYPGNKGCFSTTMHSILAFCCVVSIVLHCNTCSCAVSLVLLAYCIQLDMSVKYSACIVDGYQLLHIFIQTS